MFKDQHTAIALFCIGTCVFGLCTLIANWPAPGDSAPGPAEAVLSPSSRVNLNTASIAQLEALPGIGPALARRILEFRERNGGFQSVDQLKHVPGIGDKLLSRLRPFLVVE